MLNNTLIKLLTSCVCHFSMGCPSRITVSRSTFSADFGSVPTTICSSKLTLQTGGCQIASQSYRTEDTPGHLSHTHVCTSTYASHFKTRLEVHSVGCLYFSFSGKVPVVQGMTFGEGAKQTKKSMGQEKSA